MATTELRIADSDFVSVDILLSHSSLVNLQKKTTYFEMCQSRRFPVAVSVAFFFLSFFHRSGANLLESFRNEGHIYNCRPFYRRQLLV